MGLFLIASPFFLGFRDDGAATWVPVALGVVMVLVSLFTDNEAGLARRIPMPIEPALWALHVLRQKPSPIGSAFGASPWSFTPARRFRAGNPILQLSKFAGEPCPQGVFYHIIRKEERRSPAIAGTSSTPCLKAGVSAPRVTYEKVFSSGNPGSRYGYGGWPSLGAF